MFGELRNDAVLLRLASTLAGNDSQRDSQASGRWRTGATGHGFAVQRSERERAPRHVGGRPPRGLQNRLRGVRRRSPEYAFGRLRPPTGGMTANDSQCRNAIGRSGDEPTSQAAPRPAVANPTAGDSPRARVFSIRPASKDGSVERYRLLAITLSNRKRRLNTPSWCSRVVVRWR
jgi:hypothetical protein